MNRTDIIEKLQEAGYNAETQDAVENGVVFEGIVIKQEGNAIAPVIYTEAVIEAAETWGKTLDEVVQAIIRTYKENASPDLDLDEMLSREGVLKGLRIGLQKVSTEEIVKEQTEFPGIEKYLHTQGDLPDGTYNIRIKPKLLENLQITEAEAWEIAEKNTFAETVIEGMSKALIGLYDEIPDEFKDAVFEVEEDLTYIVSNKKRHRGASAILDKKAIKEFAAMHGYRRFAVIPSSIHECIIIPAQEANKEELDDMIRQVNATQVEPEEVLGSEAFFIEA